MKKIRITALAALSGLVFNGLSFSGLSFSGIVFSGAVLMAGATSAQEIDHVHLRKIEALQFHTVLDQAMLQSPAHREIEARQQEAQSHENVGKSWIAGQPSAQVEYFDDRSLTNVGQTELSYGVAMPLWRPGERGEMQNLGQSYSNQASEWQRQFELHVAGKLRQSLADLHEAETLLGVEQQATRDARELLRIVEQLYSAGEVAQLDVMQSRNLLLAQQRNELQADAVNVDAERSYIALTGMSESPANPHSEIRVASDEIRSEHPLLQYLQSDIDLQAANTRKAEVRAKGSPVLTLGSRRQRPNIGAGYENALAISVSIPFGGKSFVNAASSEARRAKVDAEVQYFSAQRELNAQLHEVEHQLFTIDQALPLSETQASLSKQQWDMARAAFELGEIDLSRVVIAMQAARASAKEFKMLSMQHQRLIAEYNQIIGVLP